jgi:hypothetical protein
VLAAAGADASFGTRLAAGLQAAGLEHVGAEVHTTVVAGGAEHWVRGSIQQLAARMADTAWSAPSRSRASCPWPPPGRVGLARAALGAAS